MTGLHNNTFMPARAIWPLFIAAACWPVWPWFVARLLDRCDQPWGIAPLLAAVVYAWRNRVSPRCQWRHDLLACVPIVLLYAATFHCLPPLVRAGIAMTAMTVAISVCILGRRFHFGLWALLILSLPAILTFQFYAGFPLRLVVSKAAAILLRSTGLAVHASGTGLVMGGQTISVDAPCSGVKMLWTGGFVFFVLATFRGMATWRMVVAGATAFCLVVLANILRASSLFYLESGLIPAPSSAHTGIGVVIFAITVVGIAAIVAALSPSCDTAATPRCRRRPAWVFLSPVAAQILLGLSLLITAAAPLWAPSPPQTVGAHAFPGWPKQFEGLPLSPQPLSEQERLFEQSFPGRTGKFAAGPRSVTLRWLHKPTRSLHRPEVCFKGEGYVVHHLPLRRDADGTTWSTFSVARNGQKRVVRNRVYDKNGNSWPDISSWFWAAATGKSVGPWWAVTVCE